MKPEPGCCSIAFEQVGVIGLSRADVAAVRRAVDIVSGLVTEDTGVARLSIVLDDRIWLDERTPRAS